ncbi:hypothetical protein HHI36_011388 [Cryptolaemus montrouzieri]|uniref:Uncharacterized protein n=1 Tax=Cryptolaemus montrouzieri TaxID=559131 RepID=A0ABD2MLL7_9CUCU
MLSSCRILFVLSIFSLATARFDFRLHYCRFRCSNVCENMKESSYLDTMESGSGAFYWRDYYGVVPPDAYPLGNSNQNPQTYIGMAYDGSSNGTFTTTIVEGLNYVYTNKGGKITKVTSPIQILCTREPESLLWVKLTRQNIKSLKKGDILVIGGLYLTTRAQYSYITRTTKCKIYYAGYVSALNTSMQYALLDGKNATSDAFTWLLYRPKGMPGSNEDTKSYAHFSVIITNIVSDQIQLYHRFSSK